MTKTGQIAGIMKKGGYQGRNGYIHTFNMTVTFPDGQQVGEIGSKSENYPMNVGDEILVEITSDQHGTKFTRQNPDYAGSGSQGGGGQKSDPNKDLYIKREVAIKAVLGSPTIPNNQFGVYLLAVMNWIETGRWQVLASPHARRCASATQDDVPPPTDGDDVPF